jgi:hypothetical protein
MNRRALLPVLSLTLACGGADHTVTARPADVPGNQVADEDLAALLARYDQLPEGSERDALSRRIDTVAGQRHAVWSRLSWHRDLDDAIAEARASGKPILSLRMLGNLDEDLSCANSRFFRVALYANQSVSAYLRNHFVLHWSSERPVPVARIDFGDGRVLERTIAGNSAHYVLDSKGRPVDVLPGLYSPALFVEALDRALPLAERAGALGADDHAAEVAAFHMEQAAAARVRFASLGTIELGNPGTDIASAESRAISKAAVEMPVVRSFQLGTDLELAEAGRRLPQDRIWTAIGEKLGVARLDHRSRGLFAALRPGDWARAGQPIPDASIGALIAAFEQIMTRDAAYNELVLHQQIHARLASGETTRFDELNRWVYATLFLTPAEDPWLGMATPTVFSGIPNDGIVVATPNQRLVP